MIIADFFAIETFLRQGAPAKSLETTDSDKGSTFLIGASFSAAVVLPLLLNLLRVGQIALSVASWLGFAHAWRLQLSHSFGRSHATHHFR